VAFIVKQYQASFQTTINKPKQVGFHFLFVHV